MLSLIIKELETNEISTLKSLWCILKCFHVYIRFSVEAFILFLKRFAHENDVCNMGAKMSDKRCFFCPWFGLSFCMFLYVSVCLY